MFRLEDDSIGKHNFGFKRRWNKDCHGKHMQKMTYQERDFSGTWRRRGDDPPDVNLLNYSVSISPQTEEKEQDRTHEHPILEYSEVTGLEAIGIGDRVCVDLIERLELGEGVLVGSTANAMILVHGETVPSEYVPTRPFRVNAGAVHSYCLMADKNTKYLSELTSGDKVAVINEEGRIRSSTVGRVKIERRPFLLLKYGHGSVFGQAASTGGNNQIAWRW